MVQAFDPKRVLRMVGPQLLQPFLQRMNVSLQINWNAASKDLVEEVFSAWQALPDASRNRIEVVLQDVSEMANEEGVKTLIEEGIYLQEDLREPINQLSSKYEMAMWAFLNHSEVWDRSLCFARADSNEGGRYWRQRKDLKKVDPVIDDAALREFERSLSDFFVNHQGRGHYCKVAHYLRRDAQDYFFAYLSDYAEAFDYFDGSGSLTRGSEQRAYEVMFAFDRKDGVLSLCSKGGRKVLDPLQSIFARVILNQQLSADGFNQPAFTLDHLMDRSFGFPTDPEDGIAEVAVRRLRLSIAGQRQRRILLETTPEHGRDAIYDMIDRDLDRRNLPRKIIQVTKATLALRFTNQSAHRSLSFDVSFPNSCSLKSKREELRALGEKYMRRWAINVA